MKKILLPLMSLAALQLAYSGPVYSGEYMPQADGSVVPLSDVPEHKVKLCHKPERTVGKPRTIVVAESALAAHMAHGDTPGECGSDAQPE
jgi:hypothetical protein